MGRLNWDMKFRCVYKSELNPEVKFIYATLDDIADPDMKSGPFSVVADWMTHDGYKWIETDRHTELKDRNGKEVYEGDILKVPDLYECPENTSMTYHNDVIDFKNFTFNIGGSPLGDDYEYISDECEVIGNIYENKELITNDQTSIQDTTN